MEKQVLSTDQKRLLPVFMKPGLITALCEEAGITRSLYYQWRRKNPAFRETLDAYVEDAVREARDNLKSLYLKSVQKLNERLDSTNDTIVVRCIEIVLEYQFKYYEQDAIVEEIRKIKEHLGLPDTKRIDSRPSLDKRKSPNDNST